MHTSELIETLSRIVFTYLLFCFVLLLLLLLPLLLVNKRTPTHVAVCSSVLTVGIMKCSNTCLTSERPLFYHGCKTKSKTVEAVPPIWISLLAVPFA